MSFLYFDFFKMCLLEMTAAHEHITVSRQLAAGKLNFRIFAANAIITEKRHSKLIPGTAETGIHLHG